MRRKKERARAVRAKTQQPRMHAERHHLLSRLATIGERPLASHLVRAALVALLAVILLRCAWVSDDAFITLRSIDNFVHGYGLRWNVAERVQSYTHPLWMLLLSIPYAATREPFYTTVTLGLAVSLAFATLLAWRVARTTTSVLLALLALMLSRSFVDYSTSGLENPLTHLLLLAFVFAFQEGQEPRRSLLLGFIAGLLIFNRMDNVLLVTPALLFEIARRSGVRGGARVAVGFIPLLLWGLFATLYYGSPFPNTLLAKTQTGLPAGEVAAQGLRYLQNSCANDPLTLAFVAATLVAVIWRRRSAELPLALGATAYIFYVVLIGGDFMSGRFLAAPFVMSVLLVARFDTVRPRLLAPSLAGVIVLGALAPFPTFTSGTRFGMHTEKLIDDYGIVDERRYYFGRLGLFNGAPLRKRPTPSATVEGRELRRLSPAVSAGAAVGVLGFYAGPNVHIVDYHALADPLLAHLRPILDDPRYQRVFREWRGHAPKRTWRPGHLLRNIPPGYLAALAGGAARLESPALSTLYERIQLLTRAPIWSAERLALVARTAWSPRPARPGDPPNAHPVAWDEIIELRPNHPEAYMRLALQLRAAQRADEALQRLDRALSLDPDHVSALTNRAELHAAKGDFESALRDVRRASALEPLSSKILEQLGLVHYMRGESDAAIRVFQRALAVDPSLTSALGNIGLAYAQQGNHGAARFWYERAKRFAPDVAVLRENLAATLLSLGEPQAALQELEQALRIDPGVPEVHLLVGRAHARLGELDAAEERLERAIELDAKYAEAFYRLGEIKQARGNRAAAVSLWRRAAALGFAPAREALRASGASP
jgi:arabinofuranosyltransferase